MSLVSLSTLRTRARRRADQEGSLFCSDDEVTDYVSEGAKRLHELLVSAFGEDYVKKASTLSLVAGTTDYALPSDFFKLTAVDLTISGKAVPLKRYNEAERDAWKNLSTVSWFSVPRYKLEGDNIRLLPAPTSVMSGSLIYIPLLQILVGGTGSTYVNTFTTANGTDTVNFPNGWEKFVTAYAAEQLMMKEESPTREIRAQLDRWESELKDIASNRDAAHPQSAVDHDLEELDPRWW